MNQDEKLCALPLSVGAGFQPALFAEFPVVDGTNPPETLGPDQPHCQNQDGHCCKQVYSGGHAHQSSGEALG